jgi:hypothetical protein
VVAEIGTDAFRNDDTGAHNAVTRKLVFRAPASANAVVSAISTELAALMDSNGGKLDDARNQLATRLGVPPTSCWKTTTRKPTATSRPRCRPRSSRRST